jgi:transcriptional regulator with XRE-family HTH domain
VGNFGEEVKRRREALNLSHRRLAELADNICTHAYIQKLEKSSGNSIRVGDKIIEKIAIALNWDINEARSSAGLMPQNFKVTQSQDSRLSRLGICFQNMSDTYKNTILMIAETFVASSLDTAHEDMDSDVVLVLPKSGERAVRPNVLDLKKEKGSHG